MKLKPCPFCGSENCRTLGGYAVEGYWVHCECGAIGPSTNTAEDAVTLWNSRAIDWVSADEETPDSDEWVIVHMALEPDGTECITQGWYGGDVYTFDWKVLLNGKLTKPYPHEVKHWMPIPEVQDE